MTLSGPKYHKSPIFMARLYANALYAVILCPSVCLSVCLSQVNIVPKWLNIGSAVNHKICTSSFVTFQHSLQQLKCTSPWSSISAKLEFRCRRIVILLFKLYSHFPCRQRVRRQQIHQFLQFRI